MRESMRQGWNHALLLLAAAVLAGCASSRVPAPVEDRAPSASRPQSAVVAGTMPTDTAKPVAGTENAGRPGYYTVRPGDTLIRIALDTGQNWRDLVRWNTIENP